MSVIDQSKPVLVFLAAGVQGGAVVRAALSRGLRVRALVRDRNRTPELDLPGVELAEADLRDVEALHAVSRGVDHAVLHLPIGPVETMAAQAHNVFAAFRAAGMRSFILKLNSTSRPEPCPERPWCTNVPLMVSARPLQPSRAFDAIQIQ